MPRTSLKRARVAVGFRFDPELDRAVEHLKVDSGFDKSSIAELALRMLVAIADEGKVPDDLGEVLARRDPEALEMLVELVDRVKRARGGHG